MQFKIVFDFEKLVLEILWLVVCVSALLSIVRMVDGDSRETSPSGHYQLTHVDCAVNHVALLSQNVLMCCQKRKANLKKQKNFNVDSPDFLFTKQVEWDYKYINHHHLEFGADLKQSECVSFKVF